MYNISIYGLGYVGCISLACLSKSGFSVIGVDINQKKVNQINEGIPTIKEDKVAEIIKESKDKGLIYATTDHEYALINSDITLIAVGTPSAKNGHLDISAIYSLAETIGLALAKKNKYHQIAIRSTVFPGTCEKFASIIENITGRKKHIDFAVLSNPEFIREGSAVDDYFNPPYTLIGCENLEEGKRFSEIYKTLTSEIIITQTKTAEILKYINNSFHALKIVFANEVGSICKSLSIDSHELMKIFCMDKRLNISEYYLKPGFAYGGSCLPKDLLALESIARDNNVKVPVIDSINVSNNYQIQRAINIISKFVYNKIGILGLTFKEGTDDFRNSPSVYLVEYLIEKGCEIKIFDINLTPACFTEVSKESVQTKIPHLFNIMLNDITDLLEFAEVIVICTKEKSYLNKIKNYKSKIIIDLVHLDESLFGFENYYGIN